MKQLSLLLAFFALAFVGQAADVRKISPADAAKAVAEGKAVLVDVREPGEWAESGVAAPAELLPTSDFNGPKALWKPFLEKTAGKQLILRVHEQRLRRELKLRGTDLVKVTELQAQLAKVSSALAELA